MANLYRRGGRGPFYARVKDPLTNRWLSVSTHETDLDRARRVQEDLERGLRAGTLSPARGLDANPRVSELAERWLSERASDPRLRNHVSERAHVRRYVIPVLGAMRVQDVTRGVVLRFVKAQERAGLKPKTVRNIHGTRHSLFAWIVDEQELLQTNPCSLGRNKLPRTTSADKRRHRERNTFTREEVRELVTSPKIPDDRRILYALAFFTGTRRSEAIALQWCDYDSSTLPLGRIIVRRTYRHATTKTDVERPVPVHPWLAALLDGWHRDGFARHVGRHPRPEDPIAPKRDGMTRSPWWALVGLKEDLAEIGLRTRGMHSLRRAFESLSIGDGAPRESIRALLHTSDRDSTDIYFAPEWSQLCAAVRCLDLGIDAAEPTSDAAAKPRSDLAASRGQEPRFAAPVAASAARSNLKPPKDGHFQPWNLVTPPGVEPGLPA